MDAWIVLVIWPLFGLCVWPYSSFNSAKLQGLRYSPVSFYGAIERCQTWLQGTELSTFILQVLEGLGQESSTVKGKYGMKEVEKSPAPGWRQPTTYWWRGMWSATTATATASEGTHLLLFLLIYASRSFHWIRAFFAKQSFSSWMGVK